MTIRLAVFDCDGTLSDGQAAVCAAMASAFSQNGLPVPPAAAARRSVGLSLPQAVAQLAPHADHARVQHIVEAYKQAFRLARSTKALHEPLFGGIPELLERLHSAGWLLGVATGKSSRGLVNCLTSHGIFDQFITLQTADQHPSKPHPSMLEQAMADAAANPADTVMIGDTVYDMEMARAAGVRALGVAWGYHRPEELIAAGAKAVARTPAELGDLLHV